MSTAESFTQLTLDTQSQKTSQDGSVTAGTPLAHSSADWWARLPHSFQVVDSGGQTRVFLLDPNAPQRGAYSTLNIGVSRSAGNEFSSLADVLETTVPPQYYLSPKACRGIIRRAAKRGKALPPQLMRALVAVAEQDQETTPSST